MEQQKTKKKGRPAQLLKIAELSAFVEFLKAKKERSELQDQVIDALQQKDFNFELLSEAQQILVKEALKPYREHTKLAILAEQLKFEQNRSEYENKFLQLYKNYEQDSLSTSDLNILKMMCTRYLNFKAQKLKTSDLDLYLSQLEKKEAKKKRSAENQRKFELGGAVLAAFNKLNTDISNESPERITNRIVNVTRFYKRVRRSLIFKDVQKYEKEYFEANKLFIQVLEGLHIWEVKSEKLSIIEIKKALDKRDK